MERKLGDEIIEFAERIRKESMNEPRCMMNSCERRAGDGNFCVYHRIMANDLNRRDKHSLYVSDGFIYFGIAAMMVGVVLYAIFSK